MTIRISSAVNTPLFEDFRELQVKRAESCREFKQRDPTEAEQKKKRNSKNGTHKNIFLIPHTINTLVSTDSHIKFLQRWSSLEEFRS